MTFLHIGTNINKAHRHIHSPHANTHICSYTYILNIHRLTHTYTAIDEPFSVCLCLNLNLGSSYDNTHVFAFLGLVYTNSCLQLSNFQYVYVSPVPYQLILDGCLSWVISLP